MKKLMTLLLLIGVSLSAINSNITSVTVFTDRAQVTRTASKQFTTGEHTIIFDELPNKIEQNSVQVTGKGNAILRDVKFKTEHLEDVSDEEIKKLQDKKTELLDEKSILDDKISLSQDEKKLVKSILSKLTSTNKESESSILDPEKWIKMVEFYRTKQEMLNSEIRETAKLRRELDKQIDKISRELKKFRQFTSKTKNIIEVLFDAQKEGNYTFELSYIVRGPSWNPVYDLRVDSKAKKMNLTYNGNVRQSTGEDWNNVDLKLSTAKPNLSAQPPKLSPKYISIYRPRPVTARAMQPKADGGRSNEVAMAVESISAMQEGDIKLQEKIQYSTSTVKSGATSVVFDIDGKNTIISDKEPHKVTITIQEFSAGFRYSTIPKHSQFAYLKAKVKNDSDYPFLEGTTNVFLDNNFVANSHLNAIAPVEEFWTFLGVDEGIKVEYKFIKKYDETGGVFVEKNKKIFEYLITITNNKKTQEEIVVWDQLPISQNENIKVKLIEPKYKEDTEILKIDDHKFIEWFFKPKAGEKIKIPFNYSVEYPLGTNIKGL